MAAIAERVPAKSKGGSCLRPTLMAKYSEPQMQQTVMNTRTEVLDCKSVSLCVLLDEEHVQRTSRLVTVFVVEVVFNGVEAAGKMFEFVAQHVR